MNNSFFRKFLLEMRSKCLWKHCHIFSFSFSIEWCQFHLFSTIKKDSHQVIRKNDWNDLSIRISSHIIKWIFIYKLNLDLGLDLDFIYLHYRFQIDSISFIHFFWSSTSLVSRLYVSDMHYARVSRRRNEKKKKKRSLNWNET